MVNQVVVICHWQLVNNFEAKMVRRKHISHVYLQDTKYSNTGPEMGVMSTQGDQLNCIRDEAGISL